MVPPTRLTEWPRRRWPDVRDGPNADPQSCRSRNPALPSIDQRTSAGISFSPIFRSTIAPIGRVSAQLTWQPHSETLVIVIGKRLPSESTRILGKQEGSRSARSIQPWACILALSSRSTFENAETPVCVPSHSIEAWPSSQGNRRAQPRCQRGPTRRRSIAISLSTCASCLDRLPRRSTLGAAASASRLI